MRRGPYVTQIQQIDHFLYRSATSLIKQALDRFNTVRFKKIQLIVLKFDLTPLNVNKSGVESRFTPVKVVETA